VIAGMAVIAQTASFGLEVAAQIECRTFVRENPQQLGIIVGHRIFSAARLPSGMPSEIMSFDGGPQHETEIPMTMKMCGAAAVHTCAR
jgi:hypothetical protein